MLSGYKLIFTISAQLVTELKLNIYIYIDHILKFLYLIR